MITFRKSPDGNHFYKVVAPSRVIHVGLWEKEQSSTQIIKALNVGIESTIEAGAALINSLPGIPDRDTVESTEEEFESKLQEAIFTLGIYEQCKSK